MVREPQEQGMLIPARSMLLSLGMQLKLKLHIENSKRSMVFFD